jgi:hypothetical protein
MKLIIMCCVAIVSFCCVSCEGSRFAEGIILDKLTAKPLDSVVCIALSGEDKMITDSTGKFRLTNPMGGCVPKCKEIIIQLSKTGYKTATFTNPSDSIFYLER